VLGPFFHAWERRIASATTNRVVRDFDWGLDWLPPNGHRPGRSPQDRIEAWSREALENSDAFFSAPPTDDYEFDPATKRLTYPSAVATPHSQNNVVHARYVAAPESRWTRGRPRRAVVVLPQWNADQRGHIGLCELLARFGLHALRLSLPYHDWRMPPELERADYIVSSNIVRTLQVCRQAVLDTRRAIDWLERQGFERIGILGTSLGSCLAMLTTTHDERITAAALNHVSPYFADVVWDGLSTEHVRAGLEGHVDLETLRRLWLPISPVSYIERARHRKILLVYARYDLTFPLRLSRELIGEFRRREIPHRLAVLPCGHYSTGRFPFNWMDGFVLTKFLVRNV
jgi:dienelactone hydrolase